MDLLHINNNSQQFNINEVNDGVLQENKTEYLGTNYNQFKIFETNFIVHFFFFFGLKKTNIYISTTIIIIKLFMVTNLKVLLVY